MSRLIESTTAKALGTQIGRQLFDLEEMAMQTLTEMARQYTNRGIGIDTKGMEKELKTHIMAEYQRLKAEKKREV